MGFPRAGETCRLVYVPPRCLIAFAAACLASVLPAAARGGGRLDLTAYLAPRPQVGDYRVFGWRTEHAESSYREEVVSVADDARGWHVRWDRGGASYTEIVRPGARVKSAERDGARPACAAAVEWSLRSCDLHMAIGESRRFGHGYLDASLFPFFSRVRRLGHYRLAGFEPVETPSASHASALRLEAVAKEWWAPVRFERFQPVQTGRFRRGPVETTEAWFVEDVGLVAIRRFPGTPTQSAGTAPEYERWLQAARIQGQPYP